MRVCALPFKTPFVAACVLGLLTLLASTSAWAGMIGIPEPMVKLHTYQHGVEVDYIERKLTSSRWNPVVTYRNVRLMARETYGLMRWGNLLVNVSGLFGVSRPEIQFGTVDLGAAFWDRYAPDIVHISGRAPLTFEQGYGMSLGGSLRMNLFEFWGMDLSAGAQGIYSTASDAGQPSMRLRYNEWDVFVGTLWKKKRLSAYGGFDLSWVTGEISLTGQGSDLDQQTIGGMYGGLVLDFYRHLSFVTELRLFNQSSYSLQLIYHF